MRKPRFFGWRMIPFGIVAVVVVGLVVSGLWNGLMPAIFGLPAIGFWQALGLFLLSRLLIGGFGGGRGMGGPPFPRRWGDLTPEERQRFHDWMEARGPHSAPEGGPGTE